MIRSRFKLMTYGRRALAVLTTTVIVVNALGSSLGQVTMAQNPVASVARDITCAKPSDQKISLTLDGVELVACIQFAPDYVASATADDPVQSSAIVRWQPYTSMTINAIPYGVTPPSNELPPARAGIAATYRQHMADYARRDGWQILGTSAAWLFDRVVEGTTSILTAQDRPSPLGADLVSEWVVEAGERVWIVRLSQANAAAGNTLSNNSPMAWRTHLFLVSPEIDKPSSSLAAKRAADASQGQRSGGTPAILQAITNLPFPSWWNGECNVNNHPDSYPLGSSYYGVTACGPLGSSWLVNFGAGVPQYEWQCAEYSKRYLYLAYGIPPYRADGKDVVNNCPDSRFEKITNGTPNRPPLCGTVLSYSGPYAEGHTSVVTNLTIDSQGNGSIDIAEQNSSSTGKRTHQISNWYVQSSNIATNWLACGADNATSSGALVLPSSRNGMTWSLQPNSTLGIVPQPPTIAQETGIRSVYRQTGNDAVRPNATIQAELAPEDNSAPYWLSTCSEISGTSTWQISPVAPRFTWVPAQDPESGIRGYRVYWGEDPEGTAEIEVDEPAYTPPAGDVWAAVAVRYLRVAPWDKAENLGAWRTIAVWRHDNSPPSAAVQVNGGGATTQSLNVKLNLTAEDTGSGVAAMRFSTDGVAWTPWEPYAPYRAWQIKDVPDSQAVYAQVKDAAGNLSRAAYASVTAMLSVELPSSTSYRIVRSVLGMGGGTKTSASYRVQGTSGQLSGSGVLGGSSYQVRSGLWSGMTCPLAELIAAPDIRVDEAVVTLEWNAVAGVSAYHIYRGAEPYFVPGTPYDTTSNTTWTDSDGGAAPSVNHTYVVKAVNGCGESSALYRVGEFRFALTVGN